MPKHPELALRVEPGSTPSLRRFDCADTLGCEKDEAKAELERVKLRLDTLQYRLAAEDRRSVLLVLQAMDAAGKDGTIRSILSGMNPAGVDVVSFKAPGGPETAHDYLWRVHAAAPARGRIGVFNRSHYEDVLVVRVKNLVPPAVWKRRFDHINSFERMLVDEGTTIVKCFLHVSKDEQRQRLQARVDDPEKQWKFRAGDLDDRALWNEYQRAYEDTIRRTSTAHAPWHVVPADRNWVRNLAVAKLLLHTLEGLRPTLPPADPGVVGRTVV
jgi:PPK2 family polyphosphate:nucleotide phosphotransferase